MCTFVDVLKPSLAADVVHQHTAKICVARADVGQKLLQAVALFNLSVEHPGRELGAAKI